jgi:peptidoglycan hydrolase CwlO-like protein
MTQSTNNDLKYITDLLVELKSDIKETNKKIDNLSSEITDLKIDIAGMKGKLESQQGYISKIPELAEKVGELKNWRQIAIIIITGTASTVFGWILKSGRM